MPRAGKRRGSQPGQGGSGASQSREDGDTEAAFLIFLAEHSRKERALLCFLELCFLSWSITLRTAWIASGCDAAAGAAPPLLNPRLSQHPILSTCPCEADIMSRTLHIMRRLTFMNPWVLFITGDATRALYTCIALATLGLMLLAPRLWVSRRTWIKAELALRLGTAACGILCSILRGPSNCAVGAYFISLFLDGRSFGMVVWRSTWACLTHWVPCQYQGSYGLAETALTLATSLSANWAYSGQASISPAKCLATVVLVYIMPYILVNQYTRTLWRAFHQQQQQQQQQQQVQEQHHNAPAPPPEHTLPSSSAHSTPLPQTHLTCALPSRHSGLKQDILYRSPLRPSHVLSMKVHNPPGTHPSYDDVLQAAQQQVLDAAPSVAWRISMLSIPGCVQLFVFVTDMQPQQEESTAEAPGTTPTHSPQSILERLQAAMPLARVSTDALQLHGWGEHPPGAASHQPPAERVVLLSTSPVCFSSGSSSRSSSSSSSAFTAVHNSVMPSSLSLRVHAPRALVVRVLVLGADEAVIVDGRHTLHAGQQEIRLLLPQLSMPCPALRILFAAAPDSEPAPHISAPPPLLHASCSLPILPSAEAATELQGLWEATASDAAVAGGTEAAYSRWCSNFTPMLNDLSLLLTLCTPHGLPATTPRVTVCPPSTAQRAAQQHIASSLAAYLYSCKCPALLEVLRQLHSQQRPAVASRHAGARDPEHAAGAGAAADTHPAESSQTSGQKEVAAQAETSTSPPLTQQQQQQQQQQQWQQWQQQQQRHQHEWRQGFQRFVQQELRVLRLILMALEFLMVCWGMTMKAAAHVAGCDDLPSTLVMPPGYTDDLIFQTYPCGASFLQRAFHLRFMPFSPYHAYKAHDFMLLFVQLSDIFNFFSNLLAPRFIVNAQLWPWTSVIHRPGTGIAIIAQNMWHASRGTLPPSSIAALHVHFMLLKICASTFTWVPFWHEAWLLPMALAVHLLAITHCGYMLHGHSIWSPTLVLSCLLFMGVTQAVLHAAESHMHKAYARHLSARHDDGGVCVAHEHS